MNPAMKGFLFLDMFGYDPTFKFAAYRSQLGSLMTVITLFLFVVYIIGTMGYFLLGSPVPTNEFNSVSAVRAVCLARVLRAAIAPFLSPSSLFHPFCVRASICSSLDLRYCLTSVSKSIPLGGQAQNYLAFTWSKTFSRRSPQVLKPGKMR